MKKLIIIFCSVFLFSCSTDLGNSVKVDSEQKKETSSINDFNFKNDYVYISHMNSLTEKKNFKEKVDFKDVDFQIYSVVKTDKELPSNIKNEIDLENFLKESDQRYIIHYFINDLLDVSYYYHGDKLEYEVKNEEFRFRVNNSYPRKDECSLEGLRQCANYRLNTSGLVSKIVCSFTFYAYCYPILYADCFFANCTNLDEPVELIRLEEDNIVYDKGFILDKIQVLETYKIIETKPSKKIVDYMNGYRLIIN